MEPQPNQSRNALKNQIPTPVTDNKKQAKKKPMTKTHVLSDEEKVMNEAKGQPVKKQPKAVMKKKE